MNNTLIFLLSIIAVILLLESLIPILIQNVTNNYTHPVRNILGIPESRRINIKTRGETDIYEQVGTLHEKNPENTNDAVILPLYGKQTYPRSNKWYYFTFTDQINKVKLPVFNTKSNNCQGEYGCEELYDEDDVNINAYSNQFIFRRYVKNKPRYIPYI